MAWLPLLHRAHIVKQRTGYDFLDGLPKMGAWQTNIMASGLVEKTVSADFDDKFASFYLTNTFLADGINQTDASSHY